MLCSTSKVGSQKQAFSTTINCLPDEILQEIFTYLHVKQRIQIERVCKRWRAIGKERPWVWPKRLKCGAKIGNVIVTDTILASILSHCGKSLASLSLSCVCGELTIETVAKNCPNLTQICFFEIPLSNMKLLGQGCTKLKSVSWCQSGVVVASSKGVKKDAELAAFLKMCPQLECLDITNNDNLCGRCFEGISETLTSLNISCTRIKPFSADLLIARCSSLKDFRLSYCSQLQEVLPKVFNRYATTLKVLHMNGFGENSKWCKSIIFLHNLEELEIEKSGADDKLIKALAANCKKLKVLDVSKCPLITDEGLSSLATLPCLKVLNISFIEEIGGNGLEILAAQGQLEKLYAVGSPVKDRHCSALAMHCPNFCYLDICGSHVTNDAVKSFCIGIENGFLKKQVELEVGRTFVEEDVETCQRLKVTFRISAWQRAPSLLTLSANWKCL